MPTEQGYKTRQRIAPRRVVVFRSLSYSSLASGYLFDRPVVPLVASPIRPGPRRCRTRLPERRQTPRRRRRRDQLRPVNPLDRGAPAAIAFTSLRSQTFSVLTTTAECSGTAAVPGRLPVGGSHVARAPELVAATSKPRNVRPSWWWFLATRSSRSPQTSTGHRDH